MIGKFRKSEITMIVATDVAARGLDIEGVERVGASQPLVTAYSSGFCTVYHSVHYIYLDLPVMRPYRNLL